MAAVLMLGDTKVAEWSGAGNPPWPVEFAPLGTYSTAAAVLSGWPMYAKSTDTQGELRAYRGALKAVAGLLVTTPCYIYRKTYWYKDGDEWGLFGNTEPIPSTVATLDAGAPSPLTWVNVGNVVFNVTSNAALKAQDAAVSATLSNSGAAYVSGSPITQVDDSVIITAAPLSDGEGHDGTTAIARAFWKWVCTETAEEFTTDRITVSAPPSGVTRTYTAFWKPSSVKMDVEAGDNGIEVAHYSKAGLYYSKSATGEPAMPMFYARVVVGQETDRAFDRWTKTVYTVDLVSGELVPGTPVEVAATTDGDYEAAQTVRETADLAALVIYRAYSSYTHDRVAASIANTYLLKGADYTLAPSTASRFGVDGYAGAYGLSYDQPTGVDYTVMCRRAGDLAAGTFEAVDSGLFEDSETGKQWAASYILFAVDAEGEPVGPDEDPTVPEDPDQPSLPGGGGGSGGSGTPVGTGVSLQIVSADAGVTAATAVLAVGGATLLSVTFPADPVDVKSAEQGTVYLLTVTGVTPSTAIVKSVTANGTAAVNSGGKWAIPAGSGATSVVVTLGFPPLKTLLVNAVSVPTADPDNTVTVLPAPMLSPDRWAVGTPITLTPVPQPGYDHILWQRDDAAGLHDEEAGGSEYGFNLDADTVVTAGFRKPSLDVVLTVKGSEALAAQFDWTYEETSADDTVPAEMTHSMFNGSQMGIFKVGADKLQTAGDAAYNTYVDMDIKLVEVSYDGGVTWESAGGDYVALYNAQSSPRAAARVGKHTVSRAPLNDTLHVRIRLLATVSVSVGMPPVRWGGPSWQAAGSMINTGQNNWGCGFGAASISGIDAIDGTLKTATMSYYNNTLANPAATAPVATLSAQEASPYANYFDEYPSINVELGDTVTAVPTPGAGFYFAAWIDGYFSHSWEDSDEALTSEDRLLWPAENYISADSTATVIVNEGIKKVMLKLKATVTPRYVIFTQDSAPILAVRPGETAPEQIVPSVQWATAQSDSALDLMKFTAVPANAASATCIGGAGGGAFLPVVYTSWGVTAAAMEALGITTTGAVITLGAVWQVNRFNTVTAGERFSFAAFIPWGMSGNPRFDTDASYLGLYRRVHLTDAAGTHAVGDWEFVGRGAMVPNPYYPDEYWATRVSGLAQKFVVDLEFRVRWVPYVEPTTPDEPYQITVGYHETEDLAQGIVSADIAGVTTGEINSRILTPTVQPTDVVVLRAAPRTGFEFVSWVDATGTVVSTEAEHTIDPDTDGYTFLATFTASIVVPPTNTTLFHVGFVSGNAGRGSIAVRIWRDDTTVEDYTVTAAGGADYQLFDGDNAYVAAVAGTGWNFAGWVDSYGLPRGSTAGYYPLADAGVSGAALHREVYFSEQIDPVETGNVPFRAGFHDPAAVPHALALISVNGALVATLNGVQQIDMLLTEGDVVSIEIIASEGYVLSGFVDREYAVVTQPVTVHPVGVTNQGMLIVMGLAPPVVDPPPDVIPGTPVTGAGLWLFDAGEENKAYVWRSRRFETNVPTEFNTVKVARNGSAFPSAVRFRLNAYSSPETTSPATDIDIAITGDAPRKLPKIRRERYYEIEVTAKDDIECVKIATSMGDLQNG